MDRRMFKCIICPKCCDITYDGKVFEGANCKRGEQFVKQEQVSPKRTLTTTLKCTIANQTKMVPVKSKEAIDLSETKVVIAKLKRSILKELPEVGAELIIDGLPLIITG